MTPAGKAWLVLFSGVAVYERLAPEGQLLSNAADRLVEKHPILGRAAILAAGTIVTAHVGNFVPRPERFDVMSLDFFLWKRLF